MAKKTQLYAVKVLDSSGSGSISAILAGIDFAARDAAQRSSTKCPKGVVANISFGGPKNYATNQAVCMKLLHLLKLALTVADRRSCCQGRVLRCRCW